jgi:hypothetical protein
MLFLACWFFPPWWWRGYSAQKRRFLQEPHGITSQKTAFLHNSYLFQGTTYICVCMYACVHRHTHTDHHSPSLNKWSEASFWSFHSILIQDWTCNKLLTDFMPVSWSVAGKSKIVSVCVWTLAIGVSVVDWIGLAQDRYRWRALVNQ